MNARKAISTIMVLALFQSCGWFDGIDKLKEKRMATYHWEGTLYKGYGEEVWANAPVNLEGQYPKGLAYERETIAEGTTDANGHFRLEYTIDSTDARYDISPDEQGMYEVRFKVGGGYPLMTAPWKVNVDRDLTQIDHSELAINLVLGKELNENDTVFINTKPLGKHDQIVGLGDNLQGILGPISSGEYVTFKVGITSTYNHSSKINLRWGYFSIEENQKHFNIRGWPYIDTLELKF